MKTCPGLRPGLTEPALQAEIETAERATIGTMFPDHVPSSQAFGLG